MYLESTFLILISRSDDQQEEGACGGVPVESQGKEHQNTYLELI